MQYGEWIRQDWNNFICKGVYIFRQPIGIPNEQLNEY